MAPTATEQFCTWQRSYNGVSETRVREAHRLLDDLATFVGGSPESCTGKQFGQFLRDLAATGLHPNTVRKKANMIRPFFGWAQREGLVDAERLLALRAVPNPRGSSGQSKPKPYTRKEVVKLWVEVEQTYPLVPNYVVRWQAGRSRYPRVACHAQRLQIEAIVHLCLHAGLRREEVFRLSLDAIDPDNAYIVVEGAAKGTGDGQPRMREVPMTVDLRRALAEWLRFRALMAPVHDRPWLVLNSRASMNAVNPSHPAGPMTWRPFRELLHNLGSGWEYHRLRHTYATELLRSGMPIENLKELLGHSRIQQTLAYAKIVPQDNERQLRRVEESFSRAVSRSAA